MEERKNAEPVVVKQTLSGRDFAEAMSAAAYFAHPMRRRLVRAAVCLTGTLVMAALAFWVQTRWLWLPLAAAAVFLLCAVAVWFLQPRWAKNRAEAWLSSCPLAVLPETVSVFRDHAVLKSRCETMTEYFTDFALCVETGRLIAAAGGRERFLFVLRKDVLPAEEAERLSGLLHQAFEGRWYRMPEKE